MELSPIYLQRLEEATQKGIQQGIQLGIQRDQRLMVQSILQVRFGDVDEELAQVIEFLIQLETLECMQLAMQLEREELLTRFSHRSRDEII